MFVIFFVFFRAYLFVRALLDKTLSATWYIFCGQCNTVGIRS